MKTNGKKQKREKKIYKEPSLKEKVADLKRSARYHLDETYQGGIEDQIREIHWSLEKTLDLIDLLTTTKPEGPLEAPVEIYGDGK